MVEGRAVGGAGGLVTPGGVGPPPSVLQHMSAHSQVRHKVRSPDPLKFNFPHTICITLLCCLRNTLFCIFAFHFHLQYAFSFPEYSKIMQFLFFQIFHTTLHNSASHTFTDSYPFFVYLHLGFKYIACKGQYMLSLQV